MSSAADHSDTILKDKTSENKMAIDSTLPSPSPSLTSIPNLSPTDSETSAATTADKMDITPLQSPASFSSSSPSTVIDADASLSTAIDKISSHPKLADSSLRHLHKLLSGIKKTPAALSNRKFRTDNIAVKKFIMDIDGAESLLISIGFQKIDKAETGKTVQYLNLELDIAEKNMQLIDKTIALLNAKIEGGGATASSASASSSSSSSSSSTTKASPSTSSSSTPAAARVPCAGGCGFYGDAANDNYCSVCYRKKLSMPTTASNKAQPGKCIKLCGNFGSDKFKGMCSSCWTKHQTKIAQLKKIWKRGFIKAKAIVRFLKGRKPLQVNKNRCYQCSKKIGITGFECRCTFVFCARHRHPEEHCCTFDFKSIHKKKLEKDNKQVAASKIDKIDQ